MGQTVITPLQWMQCVQIIIALIALKTACQRTVFFQSLLLTLAITPLAIALPSDGSIFGIHRDTEHIVSLFAEKLLIFVFSKFQIDPNVGHFGSK